MNSRHFRQPPKLSVAKQIERMASLHPQFKVQIFDSQRVIWKGEILPTPLSDIYLIKIEYQIGKRPIIKVIDPKLILIPGAAHLPHTYADDDLCLYYPKNREWHSRLLIADTIVPWISLWLFYYEMWVSKGTWLGGGTDHAVRD